MIFFRCLVVGLAFLPVAVFAGNPTCTGKVSGVSISSGNNLYATVARKDEQGSTVYALRDVVFCNLSSESGAFSGAACSAMMSILLTAETLDQNVTLWFDQDKFNGCSHSWAHLSANGFYHFRKSNR